jgi:hypothetical protein
VRDCSLEEIRSRLKIGVENGNKLIVLDIATIHCRLEIASLVSISDHSMPVQNVGPLLLPFQDLLLDHKLRGGVIGIVKNLNQQLGLGPVQIAHGPN